MSAASSRAAGVGRAPVPGGFVHGEAVIRSGAERVAGSVRTAMVRNGRVRGADAAPPPSDAFSDAVAEAWVACLEDAAPGPLRRWIGDSHQATAAVVALATGAAAATRDDPAASERTAGATGRISGPPDTGPLKRELYDPVTGVVTNVFRDMSSTTTAIAGVEFRYHGQVVTSFGRGTTFEDAERVALLEMLERHAAHDVEGAVHRAAHPLGDPSYVDPRTLLRFAVPASETRERVAWDPEDAILWIAGIAARTGRRRHVPLQAVELGHVDESRFLHDSSNGCALGSSLSEARLFALLELVERDAFLVFWHLRLPLRRLGASGMPPEALALIDAHGSPTRRVEVFELTVDVHVPVVLCLVRDESGPVHTYVSTAAHLDPTTALLGAIQEAVVGREIYATNPTLRDAPFGEDDEVVDMFDHVRRAAHARFLPTYDFLDDGPVVPFDEWAAGFPGPPARATAADMTRRLVEDLPDPDDVTFVDLTKDASLRHGLHVAKAVVPSLMSITFGHAHRRPDPERLATALARAPHLADRARAGGGRIHDDPHPFP